MKFAAATELRGRSGRLIYAPESRYIRRSEIDMALLINTVDRARFLMTSQDRRYSESEVETPWSNSFP